MCQILHKQRTFSLDFARFSFSGTLLTLVKLLSSAFTAANDNAIFMVSEVEIAAFALAFSRYGDVGEGSPTRQKRPVFTGRV